MKKTGFYILILLTIVLFANSCCPDKKYYTIKDKDKLSFNKGDRFIYKSNLGNYDTLVVEQIKDTTEYNTDTEGLCVTQLYEEHIYYFLNTPGKRYQPNNRPYFLLKYNSDEDKINFRFFSCIPYDPEHKGQLFYPDIYYLGDSIYYNVNYYNCYNCTDTAYCNKYAYNRTNGMIFYAYPDGEEFSLFKYVSAN